MASKNMEELISKLNLVPYSDSEEEKELIDEEKVEAAMKEPSIPVVAVLNMFRTIKHSSSSSSENESEEDSSSSATSSSDHEPKEINQTSKDLSFRKKKHIQLEDPAYFLPPIKSLNISVPNEELKPIGQVLSVVDRIVAIQSTGTPALNMKTALFIENGTCIGHVFEVFGPVQKPFYSVRFNTEDDIKKLGLVPSTQIYFAPNRPKLTKYVFIEKIRDRGTDASWVNDQEPPPGIVYYSDDEKEKAAKHKRKLQPRSSNPVEDQVVKKENEEANDACGSGLFEAGQWPAIPPSISNRAKKAMNKRGNSGPKKPKQHYWPSAAQPVSDVTSSPTFIMPNVSNVMPFPLNINDPNFRQPLPPGTFSPNYYYNRPSFVRPQPFRGSSATSPRCVRPQPSRIFATSPSFVGPQPFHISSIPPPPPPYCADNFSEESGCINFDEHSKPSS